MPGALRIPSKAMQERAVTPVRKTTHDRAAAHVDVWAAGVKAMPHFVLDRQERYAQ